MRLKIFAELVVSTAAWSLYAGERIAAAAGATGKLSSPLSILDLPQAEHWCTGQALKEQHLQNVYRHLFRNGGSFDAESLHSHAELPREKAAALCEAFAGVTTSKIVQRIPSEGGLKLIVELASGHRIETVLILHDHKSSGARRCTVCVSSQVGCARACSFCATGTMGIIAHLKAAEILEQVWHARHEVPAGYSVRNVVFMGMGEPLDNFDALLGALRGLTHQSLFDLASKHVTVSTVGASPERIRRLADAAPKVRLALSLHSATLPLRQQLIPSATSMPALTDALDYHARSTGCGLMVEYLLIDGVNDRQCDADALAALGSFSRHFASSFEGLGDQTRPQDAGTLQMTPTESLRLGGRFLATPGRDGRGARVGCPAPHRHGLCRRGCLPVPAAPGR
jgi:adenine C2-methylase RlmN of 23S rRNA A2503 and tRNA A37